MGLALRLQVAQCLLAAGNQARPIRGGRAPRRGAAPAAALTLGSAFETGSQSRKFADLDRQPITGDLQLRVGLRGAPFKQIEGVFGGEEFIEPGSPPPQHRKSGFRAQPAGGLSRNRSAGRETVEIRIARRSAAAQRAAAGPRVADDLANTPHLSIVGHQQAAGPQEQGPRADW